MSEKNTDRFPTSCHYPHPFGVKGVPMSMYISSSRHLPSPLSKTEEVYFNYFKNIDHHLLEYSQIVKNAALSNWVQSLSNTNKTLQIHDQTSFNKGTRYFPSYVISINDQVDLELIIDKNQLKNVPPPLSEVYKLGRLWINGGFSSSGYFYHPANIQPALQEEEWLSDYISDKDYQSLGYPLEKLKAFYTDSGCWLMYNDEENVYCGGVECGDFYKSSKKLAEVISIIFTKLINQEHLVIEQFAPKTN